MENISDLYLCVFITLIRLTITTKIIPVTPTGTYQNGKVVNTSEITRYPVTLYI